MAGILCAFSPTVKFTRTNNPNKTNKNTHKHSEPQVTGVLECPYWGKELVWDLHTWNKHSHRGGGGINSQSRRKTKAGLVFRAGQAHLKMMFSVPRASLRREPALPPGSKPELDFPGDQIFRWTDGFPHRDAHTQGDEAVPTASPVLTPNIDLSPRCFSFPPKLFFKMWVYTPGEVNRPWGTWVICTCLL